MSKLFFIFKIFVLFSRENIFYSTTKNYFKECKKRNIKYIVVVFYSIIFSGGFFLLLKKKTYHEEKYKKIKKKYRFMYSNEKIRFYIIVFLSFCVLSSKNILIYNEETLVALSFFCFLFFVYHYFGITIRDSLNERSQYIQYELQNFLTLKENSFQELLKEHEKVKGLVKAIKNIDMFTNRELTRLNIQCGKALKTLFLEQVQQKLKNLAFSSSIMQQKLQHLLSENVFSYVLLSFEKAKLQKLKKASTLSLDKVLAAPLHKKSVKNALHLLASSRRAL